MPFLCSILCICCCRLCCSIQPLVVHTDIILSDSVPYSTTMFYTQSGCKQKFLFNFNNLRKIISRMYVSGSYVFHRHECFPTFPSSLCCALVFLCFSAVVLRSVRFYSVLFSCCSEHMYPQVEVKSKQRRIQFFCSLYQQQHQLFHLFVPLTCCTPFWYSN